MIDEQRTLEIYGYISDVISPQSRKPIVAVCEECGRYREVRKDSYRALCHLCAIIVRWENRLEHKKMSEAQRKRWEDPLEHMKASNAHKKQWADILKRKKQSEALKNYWADPESRKKYSAMKQGIPYEEWKSFAREQKYCPKFNESIKQYIRDKYNNCDYISGIPDCICNNGYQLSVHHVDYNKDQGCDEHEWRLIPLSKRNHAMTNANRSFWNRLFTYAMQYDEEYYEDCASAHNIKVVSN